MAERTDDVVEATARAFWEAQYTVPWDMIMETRRDEARLQVRTMLRGFREALKARSERAGRAPTYLDRHVQHVLQDVLA